MTPDNLHRMDEGQRVRVTAGLAASIDHQPAQRQMDEQQGIEYRNLGFPASLEEVRSCL
jgi:hypothetical protein